MRANFKISIWWLIVLFPEPCAFISCANNQHPPKKGCRDVGVKLVSCLGSTLSTARVASTILRVVVDGSVVDVVRISVVVGNVVREI